MLEVLETLKVILARFDLRSLLDVLIVGLIFFWLLLLLRGTTAMALLRGMVILLLLGIFLSNVFQLAVLGWLVRNAVPALLVAIPIVFQPELRRALERIGRTGSLLTTPPQEEAQMVATLAEACERLSRQGRGALIVVERETGLRQVIDTGTRIEAVLSADLLVGIFETGTPLHDGAVVLRGNRIVAASCLLPLSERASIGVHLGTRHRAALGITEQTDAVALVVSEEAGNISLAHNGHIALQPDGAALRRSLAAALGVPALHPLLRRWRKAG